jgi:hypothetical protein
MSVKEPVSRQNIAFVPAHLKWLRTEAERTHRNVSQMVAVVVDFYLEQHQGEGDSEDSVRPPV